VEQSEGARKSEQHGEESGAICLDGMESMYTVLNSVKRISYLEFRYQNILNSKRVMI
jgi:hypothetical protein